MGEEQRATELCVAHGFALTREGTCLRCEREAAQSHARVVSRWVLPVLFGPVLVGVAAAGFAHLRTTRDEGHRGSPSRRVGQVVSERSAARDPIEIGEAASARVTAPATHAVLDAWQAELARAEATRADELAAEEAERMRADKERLDEMLRLPVETASDVPARKHGRIWQFPSEYGEQDWSGQPQHGTKHARDAPFDVADEVTDAPEASAFILVPVHVFVLRSDTVPALSASPSLAAQVPRLIAKANRIWAAAGVSLELASVTPAAAESAAFDPAVARPPVDSLRLAIPAWTRQTTGFRVYVVHDFDANGVYFGGQNDAVVRETAHSRRVEDGIDEAVPRVIAHEIGHGLGLEHVRTETHLMSGGYTGTRLGRREVDTARARAQTVPGARVVGSSAPPPAVVAVAGQALAPWQVDTHPSSHSR